MKSRAARQQPDSIARWALSMRAAVIPEASITEDTSECGCGGFTSVLDDGPHSPDEERPDAKRFRGSELQPGRRRAARPAKREKGSSRALALDAVALADEAGELDFVALAQLPADGGSSRSCRPTESKQGRHEGTRAGVSGEPPG